MAQVRRKTTRPTMKRKKPAKNNNTILLAAGVGGIVLVGIVYVLFIRGGSAPAGNLGLIPLGERKYGETALRKHTNLKRIELSMELKKIGETPERIALYHAQSNILRKMENIRWLIPWESRYSDIREQEIKNNPALAAYRLELMQRFDHMLYEMAEAIEDPTEESLARLQSYIQSSESTIRDTIQETKSKSGELGSANADVITKALTKLIDLANGKER